MACPMFLKFENGTEMPALGFGTWQAAEKECELAVEQALEAGYRLIDTAYIYQNEHIVGKVINKWLDSKKIERNDIFVTTKLFSIGLYPDKVEKYTNLSLEKLGLDYVDLYLIHIPMSMDENLLLEKGIFQATPDTDLEGCWKKMEEQVEAGRVKNIGLSNCNIAQINRILKIAKIKPVNLQIELHAYMQQNELVNYCKENGITVTAYSPLGNPGLNSFLNLVGSESKPLPDIIGNETVKAIAEKHGKTPAQILIRHILEKGIATIPKSVKPSRIRENIDVFDFSLDDDDTKVLDGLHVGPSARVVDMKFIKGFYEHPECPF